MRSPDGDCDGGGRRLLALGALPVALMQCAPQGCGDEAWKANYPAEPQFTLRHDFSLSPGLEPGKVTSCIARGARSTVAPTCAASSRATRRSTTSATGRRRPALGVRPDPRQRHHRAERRGQQQLGHHDRHQLGEQFEGCNWHAPTGDYFCDYKVSRQTVLKTSGEVDFVLRKFWDWTKYVGDAGELRLRCGRRLGRCPHHRRVPPGVCRGPL